MSCGKFKPMLAAPCGPLESVEFPVLVSPKLDGIRAMVQNGRLVSRNLKLIPNKYVQYLFARKELEGLDGELICGLPTDGDAVFGRTSSAVMSRDGKPPVTFWVFDRYDCSYTFRDRIKLVKQIHNHVYKKLPCVPAHGNNVHSCVQVVPHLLCSSIEHLLIEERDFLKAGYEGIMLRSYDGPYKQGRSTRHEGYLLKLKRFVDSEAKILGVEELYTNQNEQERDNLGHSKRSSKKAGLVPAGKMGALLVRDCKTGIEFNVGSGFNEADRANFWENRKLVPGLIIKYKSMPIGVKDKPRFPIYLGIRDKRDM